MDPLRGRAFDFHEKDVEVRYDRHPDFCPSCHHKISPKIGVRLLSGVGATSRWLQIVCRCPNLDCGRSFFAFYEGAPQYGTRNNSESWYFFKRCLPGLPLPPNIPERLKKLSPTFASVMEEATAGEYFGLKLIAGPGYRKALEFLVKDFIVSRADKLGTTKEEIVGLPLAKCIAKFVSDPLTKKVAEKATWLGNDETHYVRVWNEKDIEDLKRLLHITCNGFDSLLTSEEYEASMSKPHG